MDRDPFDLTGRVAIVTGGAGLLGPQHAVAIAERGGVPVLADIRADAARARAEELGAKSGATIGAVGVDIADPAAVSSMLAEVLARYGRIDILINNAAHNATVTSHSDEGASRFERFPLDRWQQDISVGLTGTFLCSQIIGSEMARRGRGVIVNIASDLALIAPDQRIYRRDGVAEEQQPVKPVSYSVVKAAVLGLTRYLATYWADRGIRVNALSPGGVFDRQPDEFVRKLTPLIPLGRMANPDEYRGAIAFLCSDASSYMTGANLVMDGGRTCW